MDGIAGHGIPGLGRIVPGRRAQPARPTDAFRVDTVPLDSVAGAAPAHAVSPSTSFPDQPSGRDRRAAARARLMLSDLSALQAGLLSGDADPAVLRRLAAAAAQGVAADPILAEALAGISLRAQVELARRGNTVASR